jgi:intracellular septation protein A
VEILLGFTPYLAFFVVIRIGAVEAAMWAAFAVAVLVVLYGRWRGRSAKILEIGAVALFGALAVFTAVAHWDWSLMAVRFAVDLGLLAIVLISTAIGRPFTM